MQTCKKISKCFLIEKSRAPRSRKKILAFIILLIGLLFISAFQYAGCVSADGILEMAKEGGLEKIGTDAYGSDEPTDLRMMVVNAIQIFLGVLALIFVVYLLWAGFNWMTASGDTKKVDDAKAHIKNAVFGLVIIMAAWGITLFVFLQIGDVTNTQIE